MDANSAEFHVDRHAAWVVAGVLIAAGLFMLYPLVTGVAGLMGRIVGGLGPILILGGVLVGARLAETRPVLTITGHGLRYLWLSNREIPWSEISQIARITKGERDKIGFAVRDARLLPIGPGRLLARALNRLTGLPPIVIDTHLLNGSTQAIEEAVRHYSGRELSQILIETPD